MPLKVGTRVRLLGAFIGPTFERDWSETGRIARHHKSWRGQEASVPEGYHTVRFDIDGSRLMVHRERIMVCNDQS